ncbi:MAG: hypothetical protein AAF442_01730 [Pseudomonadota bacterium]
MMYTTGMIWLSVSHFFERWGVVALLLAGLLTPLAMAQSQADPQSPTVIQRLQNMLPDLRAPFAPRGIQDTVETYLQAAKKRDFNNMYHLLAPDVKNRVTEYEYVKIGKRSMYQIAPFSRAFDYKVLRVLDRTERATVTVLTSHPDIPIFTRELLIARQKRTDANMYIREQIEKGMIPLIQQEIKVPLVNIDDQWFIAKGILTIPRS